LDNGKKIVCNVFCSGKITAQSIQMVLIIINSPYIESLIYFEHGHYLNQQILVILAQALAKLAKCHNVVFGVAQVWQVW
jgi:hypothetical protein